jgi:hypothetical protein
LFLLTQASHPRKQQVFSCLLLALLWLDLRTHLPVQNPTVQADVYTPGLVRAELAMRPEPAPGQSRVMVSPWADTLFSQPTPQDVRQTFLAHRLGYFADSNLLDATPKVNGFFSLAPFYSSQMSMLLYFSTNSSFPRLNDFLSVSHITAPGEVTEWQPRSTFLPEITAGQQPLFLDDTNTIRGLIRPDFEPAKTVYLPIEAQPLVSVSHPTDARVRSPRFDFTRVEFDVAASEPSLAVLSQSWYHRWCAYVDGRPVRLLRANLAFQALAVPAGQHHVRLAYEDLPFRVGALLSGLAWLGCLVVMLWRRRA